MDVRGCSGSTLLCRPPAEARSSASSWRSRAADILDLDRYMRAARPARSRLDLTERLVVDAGQVARAPPPPSSSSDDTPPAPRGAVAVRGNSGAARGGAVTTRGGAVAARGGSVLARGGAVTTRGGAVTARGDSVATRKRFSHDSGLSESSYGDSRNCRPHSVCRCSGGRAPAVEAAEGRAGRVEATEAPEGGAHPSLRALHAALERALRDQQAQITRVAQLCEQQARTRPARGVRARRTPTESSELSSSSLSTRGSAPRGKNRTEDCRTYKIIMSKLDELNRLFAARRAPPSPAPPPRRDSSSVTVSDKLVATDFPQEITAAKSRTHRGSSKRLVERGAGSESKCGGSTRLDERNGERNGERVVERSGERNSERIGERLGERSHVVCPVSVEGARCSQHTSAGSGAAPSSSGSAPQRFDLEDPVHLYAQAKRLQALHAVTRRARSADTPHDSRHTSGSAFGAGLGARRGPSLCALCRAYWRLARRCLAAPLAAARAS